MEHRISVDEREHSFHGQNRLNSFRKENRFCDFIIKVGSDEIPVHRIVICSHSDYFDKMLSYDTREKSTGVVELKDVDQECTVKVVDFMYTGETCVLKEKCGDLMHVATMFLLPTMCNAIGDFLERNLDCKSFVSTKNLADLYSCQKLVNACNQYALKHFQEITQSEEFKELDSEYIGFLLGSENAKASEGVKCKSVIEWIKHDSSSRKTLLLPLMEKLDLMKIPLSYRSFLLEYEALVYSSAEASRVIGMSFAKALNISSEDIPVAAVGDSKGDDDSDIDLFGSGDEEDEAAAIIREERLAAYATKKAKKPGPIAKSSIVLDVKPWDDETDMKKMDESVRTIVQDGLLWGASKVVTIAYGIQKLQISCVVEDEKIGTVFLEEEITKFEDLVQSVDIAAFNKI